MYVSLLISEQAKAVKTKQLFAVVVFECATPSLQLNNRSSSPGLFVFISTFSRKKLKLFLKKGDVIHSMFAPR